MLIVKEKRKESIFQSGEILDRGANAGLAVTIKLQLGYVEGSPYIDADLPIVVF